MLIPFGILSAAGAGVEGDFELISTSLITTNTASVVFDTSTLGSTYKHLQIRFVARSNRSGTLGFPQLRFNSDTGANYAFHGIFGNSSTVDAFAEANLTLVPVGLITAATATANAFAPMVIDILDPFSTSKNTTLKSLGGTNEEPTSNRQVRLTSAGYFSTSAITSISLFDATNDWVAGSRFSIYGIKG
jgi:hypothetical protein